MLLMLLLLTITCYQLHVISSIVHLNGIDLFEFLILIVVSGGGVTYFIRQLLAFQIAIVIPPVANKNISNSNCVWFM